MTDRPEPPTAEEMKARAEAAGLKAVQAFVPAEKPKRKGAAERVARMRERQKEAGLVQAPVPAKVLEAVKEAGGWEAWERPKSPLDGLTGWRARVLRLALWLVRAVPPR